jgi:hypothetical protein
MTTTDTMPLPEEVFILVLPGRTTSPDGRDSTPRTSPLFWSRREAELAASRLKGVEVVGYHLIRTVEIGR